MWQPSNLNDINFHLKIVEDIKKLIADNNFPNFLFYGSPGTGKTTISICLARTYLQNKFKQNFLELNASNERGINTIRTDVFEFVTHKAFNDKLKILLLDEADYLTIEAQAALRRTMEKYMNNMRLILCANSTSKIIAPIRSRCLFVRHSTTRRKLMIQSSLYSRSSGTNLMRHPGSDGCRSMQEIKGQGDEDHSMRHYNHSRIVHSMYTMEHSERAIRSKSSHCCNEH